MSKVPETIWLYRITHIQNLPHILEHGIATVGSEFANPAYKSIGSSRLIKNRKFLQAPDPPGGTFEEYIPFYLGPRSPMLLNIATGWEDIEQIPQEEIIYLISTLNEIKRAGCEWFYTNGHAYSKYKTDYMFTAEEDFDKLDWEAIYAEEWSNTEAQLERKDKKQSELMVKKYVPATCICYIGVYNEKAEQTVNSITDAAGMEIEVRQSPKKLYYDHL